MAVPKFYEFMPSVMKLLSGGPVLSTRTIRELSIADMGLSEEDRAAMLPSGVQRVADNRVQWAIHYLKRAGLIRAVRKGQYEITLDGVQAWKDVGERIDLDYLNRYESYRAFINGEGSAPSTVGGTDDDERNSPQDSLDAAYRKINDELADNLMDAIMEQSAGFFEHLVVRLLLKMGYGGSFDDAGVVVGRSGDEGIDGIIRADKFGFNSIYIQAKRWSPERTVGRQEIQQFVGALDGQRANQGLFITTSRFTREAQEYAGRTRASKIVLVDGQRLTRLMIEYDVGVSTQSVYAIKRLDSDFFDDQES